MPRIFKGSGSTLRLLIHKCVDYSALSNLKVVLYTTDPEIAVQVNEGIVVEGNKVIFTLPSTAFASMDDGVINYIIEGFVDNDFFSTERQSDYYLKTPTSYIAEGGSYQEKYLNVNENGLYEVVPDEGKDAMTKVSVNVDVQPNLGHLYADFEDYDGEGNYWRYGSDDGFDGFNYIKINASAYGEQKRTEGYNDGDITGYQRGFQEGVDSVECPTYTSQDLYLELNDELSEEEMYMKTINASDYGVDGFSSIEIMGDHFAQEMEHKGYERVVNESNVVDITENGSYYSMALERPSNLRYVYIDGQSYDTGLYISDITSIDFWWKFTEDNMPDDNKVILGCLNNGYSLIQNNFNFTFIENTTDITKCSLTFNIWTNSQSFDVAPDTWYHITWKNGDYLYVNGEQVGSATLSTYTTLQNPSTIFIGGDSATNFNRGCFGMYIYFGDTDGKDYTNYQLILRPQGIQKWSGFGDYGYLTPNGTGTYKYYNFEYSGLPRQINVNVPPVTVEVDKKISVKDNNLRLGGSTFTAIPDVFDFSQVTSMNNMFNNCTYLSDISLVSDWDTSNVTEMSYMFNSCSNLVDITPLSNWDFSGVSNLNRLNAFLNGVQVKDYSPLKDSNMFKVPWAQYYNTYIGVKYCEIFPQVECNHIPFINEYSNITSFTTFGGLVGLKYGDTSDYKFNKYPAFTYESWKNLIDGLYNFTGNGETPGSFEGKLKLHPNAYTLLTEDDIAIATSKGWVLS